MLNRRARGLASLHTAALTVFIWVFFWACAAATYRVPYVHLSREVNLLPYVLCAMGGILLSGREIVRLSARYYVMEVGEGAKLAARQTISMALLIFAMMFVTQDHRISRAFLGGFLFTSWVCLTFLNISLPGVLTKTFFANEHRLATLFVGRFTALLRAQEWIESRVALGLSPVGALSEDVWENGHSVALAHLGKLSDLRSVLSENAIGQVIMLDFPDSDGEVRRVVETCREAGCRLLIRNDIEERFAQSLIPTSENGKHFFTLQEEPLEDPFNRLQKRAFDLAIAVPVVLFILPPVILVVWIAQRFQASGPLFHSRERLGYRGKTFRMLKFRSMYCAAPNVAEEAKQAEAADVRVFPFGRFLRRSSLDEFPQFLNVLKGEMSIVGPRPYMPLLDEQFQQMSVGYRTRQLVKPGITGLAQSLGYRGAVLEHEMFQRRLFWDVHYVSHWSVWLDLQITIRTLGQVIRPPKTAF